jgi:pantetheine-phosphate adenylyltransferase
MITGAHIIIYSSNPEKDRSLFGLQERIDMVNEVFAPLHGRVKADSFQGLLVDYAERKGSTVVIRGLRAISDFEYEFQIALMNRKLAPEIHTILMMPHEKYTYLRAKKISLITWIYTTLGCLNLTIS